MSDSQSKRTLTEISHLFLSSVRERQTGGSPRPVRRPPSSVTTESIDLTPEEFAEVFAPYRDESEQVNAVAPITAVVAAHFGAEQSERVRAFARHLASQDQRIGLITLEAEGVRVSCFEPSLESADTSDSVSSDQPLDAQGMMNAIEELNVDVDRWVLHLADLRQTWARSLLRQVNHWTLLSGSTHDGIVAAYRTLKGLADLHRAELALAVYDAADERAAERVFQKLKGVCQQFLSWTLTEHTLVTAIDQVDEHTILNGRTGSDKSAPWQVISGFISRPVRDTLVHDEQLLRAGEVVQPASNSSPRQETFVNKPDASPPPAMMALQASLTDLPEESHTPEVLELPDGAQTPDGVLAAVLTHRTRGLVECSVRPPAFPGSRLAVDHERRLVLLAVAREGLADLGDIGKAYQWLIENRSLVAMALPQLNIDAHALPSLRLLIDHHDLRAELLQPLLARDTITVETYRRLRWGQKTGILLEAA